MKSVEQAQAGSESGMCTQKIQDCTRYHLSEAARLVINA